MKRSSLAAAVVAVPLLLAGCAPAASDAPSAGSSTTAAPSESAGTQALPPTIVSPGDLDGTDVTVIVDTALVVAVEEGTEAEWTGTTADATVAEFSGGGSTEGATFRPGFDARAIGSTEATLTGPDGREIEFTIAVVAP